MADFPEVTLRFHSDIRGECVDRKARIIHGYIVSEKYGVAFLLPDQPTSVYKADKESGHVGQTKAEYVFDEEPKRLDNDTKFVNKVLVAMYEDAKQKFQDERYGTGDAGQHRLQS